MEYVGFSYLSFHFFNFILFKHTTPNMTTRLFRPRLLVWLLASAFYPMQATADIAPPSDSAPTASGELDTIEVRGRRHSEDEKGANAVYRHNVSNVYVGRDYLERYQVNAAGDILKGLNGVYNMNTRTAGGVITPNIRGIAGKGRIPVTIDGTEQTVDVWMNNYGVSDRNYVDPALFRSIAVEKSPTMTRGVKSGVGGAVTIRTLDPADVVPEGEKWAFELRTEFSNNAVKPQFNLSDYFGKDYRTIGGATADGAGGGVDPWNGNTSGFGVILDGQQKVRNRNSLSGGRFGNDKLMMAVAAFKTDWVDGLAAYSYRNKGNYLAGNKGADGYQDNPISDLQRCYDQGGSASECRPKSAFIPNMAKMFPAGSEVIGSNNQTDTLLLKNNWYLPGRHKIGLQYMRTNASFGEINPFHTMLSLSMSEYNQSDPNIRRVPPSQAQGLDSEIRSDTYKLSYEWKPENISWLDLQASIWRIKTRSHRHQAGGPALMVSHPDTWHDYWHWCVNRKMNPPELSENCRTLEHNGYFDPNNTVQDFINDDTMPPESRRIHSGALQRTAVTRNGVNITTRFRLSPSLNMTVGADYQREKLDEYTTIINSDDLFNLYGSVTSLGAMAGPRSANRREWGANWDFQWQATSRLNIQAGVRYHNFKGEDDMLRRERLNRNPRYAYGGSSDQNNYSGSFLAGVRLPYLELMDEQSSRDWRQVVAVEDEYKQAENRYRDWYLLTHGAVSDTYTDTDEYRQHVVPVRERFENAKQDFENRYQYIPTGAKHNLDSCILNHECAYYRPHHYDVMINNGKLNPPDNLPFGREMFDRKVDNPQGLNGRFYQYIPGVVGNAADLNSAGNCDSSGKGFCQLVEPIGEQEKWRLPPTLKESAWAPMISMTYDVSDNGRLFARYAQMTRFPSLYEMSAHDVAILGKIPRPEYDIKPERSMSWELGYSFNLAPYWSKLRQADVRLTYFSNTIKNVLDNTDDKRITQYDRKITNGIEFQSRLDTGRFFASFGATYRLKQVMCDKSFAFSADMYYRRVPECIEGGFGPTRFYQAMQPKYSVNFDAGIRFFNEKLELGARTIYHSGISTKQYDELLEQGLDKVFTSTGRPYYWRPVLLADIYGRYLLGKQFSINFSVNNLTNRYYLDPMSNVPVPGPGRTFTFGLHGKF